MKKLMLILLTAAMLLMISCENISSHDDTTSADQQLIESIQSANNKQDISLNQLPAASQNVLTQDYSESYAEESQMAPELGYEIKMRKGVGTRIGEQCEVYFDLNGRQLIPYSATGRGMVYSRGGLDRNECFELVLPVTFIMPDGSTITIENEEGYMEIRNWFTDNPEANERPALQYPINIMYSDSTVVTINSVEEMEQAYENCGGG